MAEPFHWESSGLNANKIHLQKQKEEKHSPVQMTE